MPRSVPNIALLEPSGLTLSYPGFEFDGDGTTFPTDNSPALITDERGGQYLLVHHIGGDFVTVAGRATHNSVLDGQADASVPFDFSFINERRAMLAGGVSSVPILPGHNPLLLQAPGVSIAGGNTSWMAALVPNIHGNHRVIAPDPEPDSAYAAVPWSGGFSVGTPGPYVLLICATGRTPGAGAAGELDALIDGALVASFVHFFNRANDVQAFVPVRATLTLSAGQHTLTIQGGGANPARPGPWRAFAFYDPDNQIVTAYSANVPHTGTFVWTINFPAAQQYLLLAGFSAFGPVVTVNIGLNFGTFGGASSTADTRVVTYNVSVHEWTHAMFAALVNLPAGSQDFWFSDAFASTFSLSTDANDRSFLMLIPVPYLG